MSMVCPDVTPQTPCISAKTLQCMKPWGHPPGPDKTRGSAQCIGASLRLQGRASGTVSGHLIGPTLVCDQSPGAWDFHSDDFHLPFSPASPLPSDQLPCLPPQGLWKLFTHLNHQNSLCPWLCPNLPSTLQLESSF